MAIISNTVVYLDGDVVLEAFFAFDDALSGRRPAVLINHTWLAGMILLQRKPRNWQH